MLYEGFGKDERIKKWVDFKRVMDFKNKFVGQWLILFFVDKKNFEESTAKLDNLKCQVKNKVGFIVNRKIGKAVIRNKVRRRLREIYRHNKNKLKKNLLLVFIANQGIEKQRYKIIEDDFMQLLLKANLIEK